MQIQSRTSSLKDLAAFEAQACCGVVGQAEARVCDFRALLTFVRDWIDAENKCSGWVA